MSSHNPIRHIMVDDLSLRQYERGEEVGKKQIKENLVVCAHNHNPYIPDHYYKAWNSKFFSDAKCCDTPDLGDYFTKLLPMFCDDYLEIDGNGVVCVKEGQWNDWQIVAREFSPSVMSCILVWKKCKENQFLDLDNLITNNFKYTCLPCCSDECIKRKRGTLADIHIHAGSCLEADIAWLNFLYDPKFFLEKREQWYEDYKNHGIVKTRMDMYKLALVAKQLIEEMKKRTEEEALANDVDNAGALLWQINNKPVNTNNAVSLWFQGNRPLYEESRLIINVLNKIRRKHLALLLHYYILIKGITRVFMSVQSTQFGLEQFNRTLHAPYRGAAMDNLHLSLKQMAGNDLKGVNYIELRVGASHLKEMDTISKAINELNDKQGNDKTTVGLVCHFIKGSKWEKQYDLIDSNIDKLTGIDVAGSDIAASPGAFIAAFNRLRNNLHGKHLHYTYHAGEDFFHILDGLRVIYEAIEFLELKEGDRIGHASAAGVDPMLWAMNLDGHFPISQGKYLDNLMFAAYLYLNRVTTFSLPKKTKKKLLERINSLSAILGKPVMHWHDIEKWIINRKERCKELKNSPEYTKIIHIGCFDVFSSEELVSFQKEVLKRVKDKGIAIETMPTSNVTIGHHHSYKSYHLLTWLKWKQEGVDVPDIVLGSDETGVFPANIANEYANVLELLRTDGTIENPEKVVESIIEMSSSKVFSKLN